MCGTPLLWAPESQSQSVAAEAPMTPTTESQPASRLSASLPCRHATTISTTRDQPLRNTAGSSATVTPIGVSRSIGISRPPPRMP